MSQTPSLVGQIISGCEILEKTAEGGMGAVYRARHRALNRIVCVKILSPALSNDKKAVELFLTEARAIAELDHPNIVNVYNVGKEHGYYFIVMSFIEGQTLSAMLKKNKILPVGKVLELFDGVLQGLAAAHEKGIIHRDIKPSNILINPQGQPKLVDFGIAKKMDKTKSTKTTELAGTAYFIAPEQALGQNLDTRADLYSIGASLYYVLTGQFPYNGKNTIEIIQKHINNPVPDPNELRKDLPAWLGPAIQKLMSKNPDERFQTAKETYLYFRKMRAEDQLRLKSGNAGKAIDLGEEGPLIVVKEERTPTQTLRTQRAAYGKRTTATQPTFNSSLMPKINAAGVQPEPKHQPQPLQPPKAPAPRMQDATQVKPVNVYTPARKQAQKTFSSATTKKLVSLFVFVPLFAVFAGLVVYTFYTLGNISSVHVSPDAGLWRNIMRAFTAPVYAPNQLLMTVVCAVGIAVILTSSSIKAFAHSTTILLFLALVSFLAGLFTPDVPFMELSRVPQFLFSPEYYLCYLVVALAWGLSICWTINRSVAQGILGGALVVFSLLMAFLAAQLSIAPESQSLFFRTLFFISLFCGVCTVFYLVARSAKDSILLPFCLFLLAVGGIWTYTVSGLASSLSSSLEALSSRVEVLSYSSTRDTASTTQEEFNLPDASSAFTDIDRSNEFTGLPLEKVEEMLQPRIEKAAPGLITSDLSAFYAGLLAPYYQGGAQRMKMGIWGFALTFPVHNFNYNAQENDAYFFLIVMLYIFGLIGCAGTILTGDEL